MKFLGSILISIHYALRRFWYRYVYLRSAHWQDFRTQMLRIANYQCEVDGCAKTVHLDVHHETYANLGHEKRGDVRVLCRLHHRLVERGIHYKYRTRKS